MPHDASQSKEQMFHRPETLMMIKHMRRDASFLKQIFQIKSWSLGIAGLFIQIFPIKMIVCYLCIRMYTVYDILHHLRVRTRILILWLNMGTQSYAHTKNTWYIL